jgi:23S rRNA (adenine2503-C2)-methyltransferase
MSDSSSSSAAPPPPPARTAAWSLTPADWRAWCAAEGVPAYRGRQIWHGLYRELAADWPSLTVLPGRLRDALAQRYALPALTRADLAQAADGVSKLLLACLDGTAIETVVIPVDGRCTVCVSSQAGCAFDCAFCASGQGGWTRDLDAGEMVGQVVLAARHARPERVSHVVFMGMGEPLANYDAVLAAVRTLNDPGGLAIGARRITLSTCGVVPGIERLAGEGLQIELSVSLHAANDPLRDRLMPVNRRWPLAPLLAACADYTRRTGRIVTFEYTLVAGVNDRPEHARELAARLAGAKARVNLIPLSPVAEYDGRPSDAATCEAFARALERARVNATLRRSRGGAVAAACGQLRLRHLAAAGAARSGA